MNNTNNNEAKLVLKACLTDIAHYPDGREVVLQELDNLVVDTGLGLIMGCFTNLEPLKVIDIMWIGEGEDDWDIDPPTPQPDDIGLVHPLASTTVTCEYWDGEGMSVTPTNAVRIKGLYSALVGNGNIREFGLFADTIFFDYVIHPKIVKTSDFMLERILTVTLTRVP